MLKLMKYEVWRQAFSKVLIFGGLLALTIAFFIFYYRGSEVGATIMLTFLGLETMVVLFFAPLECLTTFDKDVSTKQGYMLFLIPKKASTILGAKLLVSLLQTVVVCGIFFTVVPWMEHLAEVKFGTYVGFTSDMREAFGETMETGTVGVIATLLLMWMFFVSMGFFVSSVPAQLGKLGSVVKVAGYFVGIALLIFIMTVLEGLVWKVTTSGAATAIFEYIYMLGVSIALFLGTAKLLDEKVSV